MIWFGRKITVVTHNGSFHADDVFACATLSLWAEKKGYRLKILRSRDPEVIKKADMVVDVGMEYDSDKNRFDHHQKGGAGARLSTIPYASFGLVWQKYGLDVCEDKEAALLVENLFVVPIDARDNGINISTPNSLRVVEHRTADMIGNFNLTWQENLHDNDKQFFKVLKFAKEILQREIVVVKAEVAGSKIVTRAILEQNNPTTLVLEKYCDWERTVSLNKGVKFVVYLHRNGHSWCVQSGRDDLEDYKSNRARLPIDWGGLRDGELEGVSGIKGAIFCTVGGWFGTATTKEGAIEMAKVALQNPSNQP